MCCVCSVRWLTSYLEWCISYPKALFIVITHSVWGSRFSDSHFEKQRQMVPHLRSHAHAHVFSSGEDSTALLSWDKTYFFFSLCSSLNNSPSLPPSCPYLLSVFLCCHVSQTGSRPLFLFFREYVDEKEVCCTPPSAGDGPVFHRLLKSSQPEIRFHPVTCCKLDLDDWY